ncbi:ribonuclease M5 [Lactobacillus sp. DCY120]|uniref:Ribonuclease M5 n=1 Tax=Bombilactobacillus apium TaxID=2675299 RepID=A0A850RC31_9LACO|nr:ribonuclease M5 [Bombilactobacillus apium]NVY96348.1 ribonuclease M5 [Bombilactobacillus apium]
MTKIKEVLVVEGRDDTARLRQVLGPVDTIETHGSALDEATLALIAKAQKKRGVIVITDPDFNGEQIRHKIVAAVPGVKQAFLRRQDSVPSNRHGSLGLEHASATVIKQVLQQVWTPDSQDKMTIPAQVLVDCGLTVGPQARKLRELVGDKLHIGYGNAKQFARRLNMFQITEIQLKTAVASAKEELYER